jgi:hypothetical protein
MSTVITTNNLAYTAAQLVDVNGGSIIRQPTAASADTFPSASSIITAFLGVADPNYTGNSFTITIVNESAFTITQTNVDATLTFVPEYTTPSVIIAPGQTVTFTFIQTDDAPAAMEVYTLSKGTIAGPAAAPFGSGATDNALVRFDGTTGGLTQNSVIIVGDTGIVTGVLDLTATGQVQAATLYGTTSLILEETGAGTDTITIQAPASIAASYTLTLPVDDGTSGQFLQTNGSGVLSWANTPSGDALFYQYGPATSVALTGTFTVVDIDTGGVVDAAFYTNVNGVVTLSTTGVYEVAYWVQFETLNNTGGTEASFAGQLFVNGTAVTGTISECWMTEAIGNLKRPGCGKNVILSLTAADTIEVRVQRSAGTTTAQTRVNESNLTIMRLR